MGEFKSENCFLKSLYNKKKFARTQNQKMDKKFELKEKEREIFFKKKRINSHRESLFISNLFIYFY